MSEPTGPLPVLTDTAALVADVRKAQDLYRQAYDLYEEILRRGFLPPVEVLELTNRIAELDLTIRKGTTQKLTRAALEGPPLAAAPAPVPAPRSHRRTRRRLPGAGQATLWPVPAIVAAFAGLKHALRHSSAAHAIGAHASLKVAAWATAGTLSAGAITGVAVVGAHVLGVGTSSAGSSASGPAPAASIYAASPVGPAPVAALTRPRAGTADVRRAQFDPDGAGPVPPYAVPSYTAPSSQQSGQAQPSVAVSSPPAGPAVLGVSDTAIDLTGAPSAVITITATGGGFVPWTVVTTGTDLDFSRMNGVLAAGGSYDLTVSLDPNQDGNTTQTFEINGDQVTVALPAPVAPAVAPSPADTSTDTPTDAPSPASS